MWGVNVTSIPIVGHFGDLDREAAGRDVLFVILGTKFVSLRFQTKCPRGSRDESPEA